MTYARHEMAVTIRYLRSWFPIRLQALMSTPPRITPRRRGAREAFESLEGRLQFAADLIALTPAASASDTVVRGTSMTLTYTLKNAGDAASLASTTRLQVRRGTDGKGPVVLTQDITEVPLAVAATLDKTLTVTLPASVRTGTYSTVLIVDVRKTAGQLRNTLNDESVGTPFTVVVGTTRRPDLAVRDVRVDQSAVDAGGTVSVRWTMANKGEAAAAATQTAVVLGTSPTVAPALGDAPLLVSLPEIAAGARVAQTAALPVPATTTTGAYYVWIFADAASPAVLSQTRTDNDRGSDRVNVIAVSTELPNLVPSLVVVDRIERALGQTLDLKWLLSNTGDGNSAATTTSVRIGTTNTEVPAAEAELISVETPALKARKALTQRATVTIPADSLAGTYYVWIVANTAADPAQAETSTTDNNAVSRGVTISTESLDRPNLVPTEVRVIRPIAGPGETVTVKFKMTNTGGAAVAATQTDLRLGSLLTTAVPGSDANLVTIATPALRHHSKVSLSAVVALPVGTLAGNYVIWAVSQGVAATATPQESTTDDADASNPLQVIDEPAGRANLVPTVLRVSTTTAEPGDTIKIKYRLFNRGRRTAPASSTLILLGESPTTAPDTGVLTVATPAIRPNRSITVTATVTLGADVARGLYYLWVKADGADPANVAQTTTADDITRANEPLHIGV